MNTEPILTYFVPAVTAVFLAAFTLYMVRVVKGPTIPDVVLAIDCLSYDLTVFVALMSIYYGTPFLAIGALLLSLWAFIFDVFVSKYLMKKDVGSG